MDTLQTISVDTKRTISVFSMLKDIPLGHSLQGNLTVDVKPLSGDRNICKPGAGIQTSIGGIDVSVQVENLDSELSKMVTIGRKLGPNFRIELQNFFHLTFVSTVTQTIPWNAEISKGIMLSQPETLIEDPDFQQAGHIVGLCIPYGFAMKLTSSLEVTSEDKDCNNESPRRAAKMTKTLEWSLRPRFSKLSTIKQPIRELVYNIQRIPAYCPSYVPPSNIICRTGQKVKQLLSEVKHFLPGSQVVGVLLTTALPIAVELYALPLFVPVMTPYLCAIHASGCLTFLGRVFTAR
ncbi:uncharacterized protein LOC114529107 [Dendronephthya gigantea]|uniref:uncharacterized protein LOC114529107 n=1 Tax=Dendronephthya gigantea TaxID=151771 RepID=UPI001068F7C5|nr:uncharacterized protein LOC114529107 [Dendronephthya gigantea]